MNVFVLIIFSTRDKYSYSKSPCDWLLEVHSVCRTQFWTLYLQPIRIHKNNHFIIEMTYRVYSIDYSPPNPYGWRIFILILLNNICTGTPLYLTGWIQDINVDVFKLSVQCLSVQHVKNIQTLQWQKKHIQTSGLDFKLPSPNQLLDSKALVWGRVSTHVHAIQWTVKLIRSFLGRIMGRYGEMVTSLHLLDNGLRKSDRPYELILRYKEFLWEFVHHWYPKSFIGSRATCPCSLIGYKLCCDLVRGKCQSDLTTPAIDLFYYGSIDRGSSLTCTLFFYL